MTKKRERCFFCGKPIDLESDKYVLVGTYNGKGKSEKDEKYFHFQCWIDWFNQKITSRIAIGQKQAMKMLGGMVKQVEMRQGV